MQCQPLGVKDTIIFLLTVYTLTETKQPAQLESWFFDFSGAFDTIFIRREADWDAEWSSSGVLD